MGFARRGGGNNKQRRRGRHEPEGLIGFPGGGIGVIVVGHTFRAEHADVAEGHSVLLGGQGSPNPLSRGVLGTDPTRVANETSASFVTHVNFEILRTTRDAIFLRFDGGLSKYSGKNKPPLLA